MLIAFDLDGTLEDSRADMVLAIQRVRADLSLPFRDYEFLVPWVSKGMPTLYAQAFDDLTDLTARQQLPEMYASAYHDVIVNSTVLYEGIAPLLHALKNHEGILLACVTNKPEVLSRVLLERLGILDCFSAVIGGDTMPFAKPHPMMLEGAMATSHAEGACIMVGDSRGDVVMAKDFGAVSVWCRWGYHTQLVDAEPDYTVDTPIAVLDLVQSLLPAAK